MCSSDLARVQPVHRQVSLSCLTATTKKCKELDKKIAEKMGFKSCFPVSGQTYARKLDTIVCNCLALIAQSCCKFSNDLRLLQNLKEIEEPFEKNQTANNVRIYCDNVYIFHNETLITVFPLPQKYRKTAEQIRRKLHENPGENQDRR